MLTIDGLFAGRIGGELVEALGRTGAVLRLAAPTRQEVLDQALAGLSQLGEMTLDGALSTALSTSLTLSQAAIDSLNSPEQKPVSLDLFEVPIEYPSTLDITVNGQPLSSVTFTVRVTPRLSSLTGIVSQGRLIRASVGVLTVDASLDVDQVTVWTSPAVTVGHGMALPLRPGGLPLVLQPGERFSGRARPVDRDG
jgi:hypothetical protein